MIRRPAVWLTSFAVLSGSAHAALNTESSAGNSATDASRARIARIVSETRPRAEDGDAAAEYNMGVLYDRGMGVKQNYAKARRWYEKAAAQHYGRAEQNLGILYESGKGVPKSLAKAAHWFRRGAYDRQAASENDLGVLYMKGLGVPQNTGKAAYWTARAAADGNAAASDNLARIVGDLPQRYVKAAHVEVREQPERSAAVVRQVAAHQPLVLLAQTSGWSQVLVPKSDQTGWVASPLLADRTAPPQNTEITDRAAPSAAPQPAKKTPLVETNTMASGAQRIASTVPPSAATPRPSSSSPVSEDKADAQRHTPAATPMAFDKTVPSPAPAKKPTAPTAPAPSKAPAPSVAPAPRAKSKPATKHAHVTRTHAKHHPHRVSHSVHRRHVGVQAVNLRSGPARSASIRGVLHRGDVVTVKQTRNGWDRVVTHSGRSGWVAGYLLVGA